MAKRQQKQQVPPGRRPVGYTDLVRWVGLQVQGKTIREIAKKVGRDKDTVNRTLKKAEAVQLRKELVAAVREDMSTRLISLNAKAVASWEKQMDLADQGHRANHLVAKDILTLARTVDIPIAKKAGPPDVVIEVAQNKPSAVSAGPQVIRLSPEDLPVDEAETNDRCGLDPHPLHERNCR